MSEPAELQRAPAPGAAVARHDPPGARDARLVDAALRSEARQLDPSTHELMRRGFGQDFSHVRLHANPLAAQSALALGAEAYAVGRDIAFAPGRYAPGTRAGTRLIAHELAHVVQQRGAHGAMPATVLAIDGGGEAEARQAASAVMSGSRARVSGAPARAFAIQRDPTPGAPAADVRPQLNIPYPGGGRLTVMPGPGPLNLLGQRFPLPGSLRLTNALGIGAGPTGVIDVDPRHLALSILGSVDLQTSLVAGTPEGHEHEPIYQRTLRLERTVAAIDLQSGLLLGSATLHVPNTYAGLPDREIDVRVTSNITDPRLWTLGASYGPVTVDAKITLHCDTDRLASALSSGGLGEVAREIAAPGLSVSGTAQLGGMPFSWFGLEAPTTRSRDQPLLGAPTPFPSTLWAAGAVLAPPGSLTSIATPAIGFTASSFGDRSGFSATAAVLPTFSPPAISAGAPAARQFPVLAFADVSYVQRISGGFELGIRATGQIDTAELLSPSRGLPAPEPGERTPQPDPLRRRADPPPAPISPYLGLSVFGEF